MEMLRNGDTLVVWRLDRLGRDLPHLLKLMENLHERAIVFRSLTESMDTSTAMGRKGGRPSKVTPAVRKQM